MLWRCVLCVMLIFGNVHSRHAPRYAELDEDEQLLFRAAYDTSHDTNYDATYEAPAYDHDQHEDDASLGKLDLLKDGLWAVKSEIKVLKALNKAFAANLLATKLKLKGLKKSLLLPVLEHHHQEPEKRPSYYQPAYVSQQSYAPPHPQYSAPAHPQYSAPAHPQYSAAAQPQYSAPAQPQYSAPAQPQYSASVQPQYQMPQQPHDPYYGL